MPKGRWNRQQSAREDKQQRKLDFTQPNLVEYKKPITVSVVEMYTGEYSCPFCLHSDKIGNFLISTKKGYHKGLGKCPECGNQMQIKSLTSDWTPEQYAEFMYEYSGQGGWQKVKFQVWSYRLNKIGWSQRFWNRYRELKGEAKTESYTDYIQRKQFEQAQEQGWTEQ
jgi:transcription elongation factor Elf1